MCATYVLLTPCISYLHMFLSIPIYDSLRSVSVYYIYTISMHTPCKLVNSLSTLHLLPTNWTSSTYSWQTLPMQDQATGRGPSCWVCWSRPAYPCRYNLIFIYTYAVYIYIHMTWHDMTWHDMTRHDTTRHDMTWHDMTYIYIYINHEGFRKHGYSPSHCLCHWPMSWMMVNLG